LAVKESVKLINGFTSASYKGRVDGSMVPQHLVEWQFEEGHSLRMKTAFRRAKFRRTTLNRMTLSRMIFSRMTFSKVSFCKMDFDRMTFIKVNFSKKIFRIMLYS
jgi:uncharacterized protein YjbI with pentapeptide repeats